MKTFTEMFENNFQARIDNGERVYLSEVYGALGFETLSSKCRHAFWDKNGFHECYTDEEITFEEQNITLPKQIYTVTMTFEELEQLRHIYEQKQNEAELIKRIISSATL